MFITLIGNRKLAPLKSVVYLRLKNNKTVLVNFIGQRYYYQHRSFQTRSISEDEDSNRGNLSNTMRGKYIVAFLKS